MRAVGPFTQQLWDAALPAFKEIVSCRFVSELAAGTLSRDCFAHYLSQDILYLKKDADALGIVATKSRREEDAVFFKQLEQDGLEVEFVLRDEYLSHFNLQEAKEQSPAFADYSIFLLNHANNSPYEVACAALLPCFWIYGAVADTIVDRNVANNPYQKFIDTYAGDEYEQYTIRFLEIVEENSVNSDLKEEIIQVFVEACKHELAVFEESVDETSFCR